MIYNDSIAKAIKAGIYPSAINPDKALTIDLILKNASEQGTDALTASHLYLLGEVASEDVIKKIRILFLKKDSLLDQGLLTLTKVGVNNDNQGIVSQNGHGSRNVYDLPSLSEVPLEEMLKGSPRSIRALLGTGNNDGNITKTLERISGLSSDRIYIGLADMHSRKSFPDRHVSFEYIDGRFVINTFAVWGKALGIKVN